jgi:hypothetical protein
MKKNSVFGEDANIFFLLYFSAISLSLTEYLEDLKRKLNLNIVCIKNLRKSLTETKILISTLDRSLTLIHISDEILSTSTIMALVYMLTVGTQDKAIKTYIFYSLFYVLVYVAKLSMDCLIHGSVYEETESFFSLLEQRLEISVNKMDENEFREYTSNRKYN